MGEETGAGGDFERLPEACISHVLSLTSPRDSCRSSAVSAAFRSAGDSDTVWGRFLPPDHREILDRADDPIACSSKRDLYFRLCDPILIDGGKMSFQLDKLSGKKCFMISARRLSIVWGDTPHYWKWIPMEDARFSEAAHLLNVCWLEINGKIDSRMLSPKTNYAAYFVFKLHAASHGLIFPLQQASVKLGAQESERTVRVQQQEPEFQIRRGRRGPGVFHRFFRGTGVTLLPRQESESEGSEDGKAPRVRADGWLEIEMGEFFNDNGDDGEVDVCFMEVKGGNWKGGLIVLGIELRPKKSETERS